VHWLIPTLLLIAETVTVNGGKVSYDTKGSGANTMVFIHGWAADRSFFDSQIQEFSKTHRVIALDLPGHGQSQQVKSANIDSFVAAVEALASKPVILVGHSMGAIVAREFARRKPNHVKGIILVDGSIFQLPPGQADRERAMESFHRLAKSFGPSSEKPIRERQISVFLSNLYADSTPRELQMSVLRKVLATSPETAESAMYSIGDLRYWSDDKLNCPVLALRAGKQQPPNDEAYLRSIFPKLTYQFMPGLSHFLMMEQPAKVNSEIRTFLKASKLE